METNPINERRSFLKKISAAAVAGTLLPVTSLSSRPSSRDDISGTRVTLGISTCSYWHFYPELVPIQHLIEEASRLGVRGVDVLHRQMESEDPDYIKALKKHALNHGVHLRSEERRVGREVRAR